MRTSANSKRLVQRMIEHPEPKNWIVLLRCGVGLATLTLLAVIEIPVKDNRDTTGQGKALDRSVLSSAQHRQEVFNERRAVYQGRAERVLAEK